MGCLLGLAARSCCAASSGPNDWRWDGLGEEVPDGPTRVATRSSRSLRWLERGVSAWQVKCKERSAIALDSAFVIAHLAGRTRPLRSGGRGTCCGPAGVNPGGPLFPLPTHFGELCPLCFDLCPAARLACTAGCGRRRRHGVSVCGWECSPGAKRKGQK